MKKKILILSSLLALVVLISSCYQSAVDSFSEWTFQIIVEFKPDYIGRHFPCDNLEYNNLNQFEEYKANKDKIKSADIVQFNYWVDSLQIVKGVPFNYNTDVCTFDSIRYSLVFAKLKSGYTDSTKTDSIYYQPNYERGEFEIAKYPLPGEQNVNAKEYWRNPSHIVSVSEERAQVISEILKYSPSYYIRTQYGNCTYNGSTINNISFIKAHFDLAIRFTVKL